MRARARANSRCEVGVAMQNGPATCSFENEARDQEGREPCIAESDVVLKKAVIGFCQLGVLGSRRAISLYVASRSICSSDHSASSVQHSLQRISVLSPHQDLLSPYTLS